VSATMARRLAADLLDAADKVDEVRAQIDAGR